MTYNLTTTSEKINTLIFFIFIQDDRAVKKLCEKAKELLMKEENIIYLNAPITVSQKNF